MVVSSPCPTVGIRVKSPPPRPCPHTSSRKEKTQEGALGILLLPPGQVHTPLSRSDVPWALGPATWAIQGPMPPRTC